jgi:hypothetical protein
MLPIRQNGLVASLHATTMPPHTPKWTDQSEHQYLHATLYAKNGWTYAILERDRHATHKTK